MFVRADGEEADLADIETIVTPLLERAQAEFDGAFTDEQGGLCLAYIYIKFRNPRGKTVVALYALAKDMLALLHAADGGVLQRETTLDLLRAGKVNVLIGQTECDWLDAERAPYRATDEGRVELAKDVAAFANSRGGIIVLGVATQRKADRDVLSGVHPVPFALARPGSYRQVLNHRIHPPVQGLDVVQVPHGKDGSGIVVISVPPQPEESRPFLVRGALIQGRVRGSYITIVTRQGEDTLSTDPAAIHSLLVAGRVALAGTRRSRRQQTPKR